MKDLLKKYIEKGYEPTFFSKQFLLDYDGLSVEYVAGKIAIGLERKLELYLMRDWLEEKHDVIIDPYRSIGGKCKIDSMIDVFFNSKLEALKSALEESIKHI